MPRSSPPLPATTPGVRRRTLLGSLLIAPTPSRQAVDNARLATEPVDTDAELIRLCAVACALDAETLAGDTAIWEAVILELCALQPASTPALRTKVQVALTLLPSVVDGSCPTWASPDERLLRSVLQDVLARTEHHDF